MPKTIETTVYEYDELPTDKAKETARDWFYNACANDDWYQSTYDDAEQFGIKITSFDCGRGNDITGKILTSAPQVAETIVANHGKDCATYNTSQEYLVELITLGDRPSDTDENADDGAWETKREEMDEEFKRDILNNYLQMLRDEFDYISTTEYLEEGIRANEYTFTETGKRFG